MQALPPPSRVSLARACFLFRPLLPSAYFPPKIIYFTLPQQSIRTTFHYPESPYGRTYADVTTKISRMDSLPNYLGYGAPLARALRARSSAMIEHGRSQINHLPRENRLCPLCNSNQVKDEIHFLFQCNKYSVQRQAFSNQMNRKILDDLL